MRSRFLSWSGGATAEAEDSDEDKKTEPFFVVGGECFVGRVVVSWILWLAAAAAAASVWARLVADVALAGAERDGVSLECRTVVTPAEDTAGERFGMNVDKREQQHKGTAHGIDIQKRITKKLKCCATSFPTRG